MSLQKSIKKWYINVPIGMELRLSNNFNLLLSVSFNSSLTEYETTGKRLFPYRIRKYWENGVLKIDDEETNRFELYTETPPTEFDRYISTGLGLEYSVKDKFRVYLKTGSDISLSNRWTFGFEYNW
ncbi:MAG: hypothetical protein H0Z29_04445 [Candidatus Marinimicrobia bacterium]|nr:hypothetical protein [Candidatus Neomarinimicrobiota bacterium]